MVTRHLAVGALVALAVASFQAQAFTQETHRRIVLDAVAYMKAHPTTTGYDKLARAARRAKYSEDQMAQVLAQGAYDVDDFADTYICGAITGDCQKAPAWGLTDGFINYTSYFHFQQHTRGPDSHGNDMGGYNYNLLTVWGDVDDMAASWLWNDHLDDGWGGMTGTCWFWGSCNETSRYNSYGVTEANYRQGSYSSKGMYEDFQGMPFQPIDNLGQYWFSQFLSKPTFQTLGFVLHTTDLLQPHHTWVTSALNHSGWETWVNDYYYSEGLNNSALVEAALADFTPLPSTATDIRPLLTQGGGYSYANGGNVLYSTDHGDRLTVAHKVVPHAIAMVVHILNRAAERL